ncbi:polynucleotide kinase-phosphatase [Chitinimonas lacunae]|uniref:Polynucleotide kinase-phosphatase n=1 Tax=Chitinimonas lacunae TaxID=1963018 RepID=A0ABV8MR30_9NEIS
MKLQIPQLALVVLVGVSGAGKSTFARRHFLPTEVISSDVCRGWVCDDENDQSASRDAFDVLHYLVDKRLKNGRLTVVDATNVDPKARQYYIELARRHHVFAVAIVLDLPERLCRDRNAERPDRQFGEHVIRYQSSQLRRSIADISREGFRYVHVLRSSEDIDQLELERVRLWNDRRDQSGPFDIIGDIHGCFDELVALLGRLGYTVGLREHDYPIAHRDGRRLIFVGDLVDRGPRTPDVLRLVMRAVADGTALCVAGNHDAKLARALGGRQVKTTHGLRESLDQLELEGQDFRRRVERFLDGLVSHYVLDAGRLVVAHAGLKESMHGRSSNGVREFALYGESTGEIDEFGLPIRYPWANDYRGRAMVVYGHTPVPQAEWLNNTICLDTGCVFGGRLTALRYPEKELVDVPAAQVYYEPIRPLHLPPPATLSAQHQADSVLDIADVVGARRIETRLGKHVTIRAENASAALEVMARFSIDPRWLVYLPPTMAPTETSTEPGFLEHPTQAFDHYRAQGVRQVVCQEKHMGSRAIVVICRDAEAARRRFGVDDGSNGIVYTRSGRPFFSDEALATAFLERLRKALDRVDFWQELASDWFVFDAELMPWSAKALQLVRDQYAATGSAAKTMLTAAAHLLEQAQARGVDAGEEVSRITQRAGLADDYIAAYQRYCWEVNSLDDYRLAPFHLLAWEGHTGFERSHGWHMSTLARLATADPDWLLATTHHIVDLDDTAAVEAATRWWLELTAAGGEGMVVKPFDFIVRNQQGLVQPALKCRGREYLRIIYGPEYTLQLDTLRRRGLSFKRSLALREFMLGVEGLARFVAQEPLRRVHECAFGVLALESEPVDPRL